jgi:predicted ATP-grasp superfamily ATP-dependent carboligase
MQALTVLGASARALAESAARAGFAPFAVDLFGDRDLRACCPAVRIARYPHDFLPALEKAPVGAWMYTGGLENHPALLARLARVRPLWGNSAEIVRPVRRPELVAQVAAEAGCRVSPAATPGAPTLLKPRRGSGGLHVRLANADEMKRPPRGWYLQALVQGNCAGAVFVAASGEAVLLGVTRQLAGSDFGLAAPFIYAGSTGPLLLPQDQITRLERLGQALANRFGLTGLFNVDLIVGQHELWVLEVNPRYSASVEILERASNTSFVALHADACCEQRLPERQPSYGGRIFGKAIVYAEGNGIVPTRFDAVCEGWSDFQPGSGMADIPHEGEALVHGQPVVTVFAAGPSCNAVEGLLHQRVSGVRAVLRRVE